MSCAIDVNILLYASDRGSPFAQRAQACLAQLVSGRELLCIAWTTVMGYLRISTHSSVFAHPLAPEEAMNNVEALLRLPHVRVLAEEEGFWDHYREIAGEVPARGNTVPDVHLAALLRQHGVNTLYTHDRDFRKFDFLKVRNPF
jgi:toxin-antitoxin system PIN domain toxin